MSDEEGEVEVEEVGAMNAYRLRRQWLAWFCPWVFLPFSASSPFHRSLFFNEYVAALSLVQRSSFIPALIPFFIQPLACTVQSTRKITTFSQPERLHQILSCLPGGLRRRQTLKVLWSFHNIVLQKAKNRESPWPFLTFFFPHSRREFHRGR